MNEKQITQLQKAAQALLPAEQRETIWWEELNCHHFLQVPLAKDEDAAKVAQAIQGAGEYVCTLLVYCGTEQDYEARAAAFKEAGFEIGHTECGVVVRRPGDPIPDHAYHEAVSNYLEHELSDEPTEAELIEFAKRFCTSRSPFPLPADFLVDDLSRILAAARTLEESSFRAAATALNLLIQRGLVRPYPARQPQIA